MVHIVVLICVTTVASPRIIVRIICSGSGVGSDAEHRILVP